MIPTAQITIEEWINRTPIGTFRTRSFLLCGTCLIFDGFDVQSMGYVAPTITSDWGLPKAALLWICFGPLDWCGADFAEMVESLLVHRCGCAGVNLCDCGPRDWGGQQIKCTTRKCDGTMKTLRLLLTQVIDYAGMYPPASLPLAE